MNKTPTTVMQECLLSEQLCQARKEVAISLAFKTVGRKDGPIKNTERACEQIERFSETQTTTSPPNTTTDETPSPPLDFADQNHDQKFNSKAEPSAPETDSK
jgi:hypothetical protein